MTKEPISTATLHFFDGIPAEDGYYIVEVDQQGTGHEKPYDIDYCRRKCASDGGGREWVSWYPHNILRWAPLPSA